MAVRTAEHGQDEGIPESLVCQKRKKCSGLNDRYFASTLERINKQGEKKLPSLPNHGVISRGK
jgi:hypothetical protein